MKHLKSQIFTLLALILSFCVVAQKGKSITEEPAKDFSSETFQGLQFRNVGPALTSGRISDLAVRPDKPSEYYVAVASGGVWKTVNNGITYQPVFDEQGSYSIGCVTLDPTNHHTVWVGTGENNNQRSVAYGDGVYKSTDGGTTWQNMGLKDSEHIGRIIIHPHNPDIVYVAAYGPLWSSGGDRGIYKSINGGKDWERILQVSEHTGFAEVVMDPHNPEILYATAHQRRRHVHTYISGGPESAIYKTTDGGENWKKLTNGLPSVHLGRIGLAVSPINPDYVFAIVEAANGQGGFYKSTDKGESWKKQSKYTTSGNYYVEIFCDPKDIDIVYSMDTWFHMTEDGGLTFKRVGEMWKHVDNHALWINPDNNQHLLTGCDGGIYETFDRGENWDFKANLPVTQFYKVALDNDKPFYNIYGGTQDNFTLGGPSRTIKQHGISNEDWFVTLGGDGFEPQVDPEDPTIVYSQYQYGNLHRYDRTSGEITEIKPVEGKGEDAYRWNWDAPVIISPHSHTRLYFAANKLFKSDDRGDTWQVISPDLTRQIDRNKLKVMGKVWSMDAVAKNGSTSIYGNLVALAESPVKEGLLYVGSDDGLIQVSEDDGKNWRKISSFPQVPEYTYVNMLLASQHEERTVYAAFNNHKQGDFKPYLLKSTDAGLTWKSIAANLPSRGSVYSIAEDHIDKNLLFAGTEFGVFVTLDGGKQWTQLKGGLPVIAVRDMEIQKRENDLVLATFGRGFYVLDDYSPLRHFDKSDLTEGHTELFPVKDAPMYIESIPLGLKGKSFQGESYYTAPNPPFGAVFTWYMNDALSTLKEQRQKQEKVKEEKGEDIFYPSFDQMRMEDSEEKPYLLFEITDDKGEVVRRIKGDAKAGFGRIAWDLRLTPIQPVTLSKPAEYNPWAEEELGPMAIPGTYKVQMYSYSREGLKKLSEPQEFKAVPLNLSTLNATDKTALLNFQKDVAELRRAVFGTQKLMGELNDQLAHMKVAIKDAPQLSLDYLQKISAIEAKLQKLDIDLNGDVSLEKRNFEVRPSVSSRLGQIVWGLWASSSAPTNSMKQNYTIAGEEFEVILKMVKEIVENDMKPLDQALETGSAPWTPGRMPEWNKR